MKKCRKVCIFKFAKKSILNKNGTWNKSWNSKNIIYMWYMRLFLANQENHCIHTTFWVFFNFTNIIDFLSIHFSYVQNSLSFHIFFKEGKFCQNGACEYNALTPSEFMKNCIKNIRTWFKQIFKIWEIKMYTTKRIYFKAVLNL